MVWKSKSQENQAGNGVEPDSSRMLHGKCSSIVSLQHCLWEEQFSLCIVRISFGCELKKRKNQTNTSLNKSGLYFSHITAVQRQAFHSGVMTPRFPSMCSFLHSTCRLPRGRRWLLRLCLSRFCFSQEKMCRSEIPLIFYDSFSGEYLHHTSLVFRWPQFSHMATPSHDEKMIQSISCVQLHWEFCYQGKMGEWILGDVSSISITLWVFWFQVPSPDLSHKVETILQVMSIKGDNTES